MSGGFNPHHNNSMVAKTRKADMGRLPVVSPNPPTTGIPPMATANPNANPVAVAGWFGNNCPVATRVRGVLDCSKATAGSKANKLRSPTANNIADSVSAPTVQNCKFCWFAKIPPAILPIAAAAAIAIKTGKFLRDKKSRLVQTTAVRAIALDIMMIIPARVGKLTGDGG